jgi:hypothetical protein
MILSGRISRLAYVGSFLMLILVTSSYSVPYFPIENRALAIITQSVITTQNRPVKIIFQGNNQFSGSGGLHPQIVMAPSHGILDNLDEIAGTVIYTPKPGFIGQDSFSFRDNSQPTILHTVTISVQEPSTSLLAQQQTGTGNVKSMSTDNNDGHHKRIKLSGASRTTGGISTTAEAHPKEKTGNKEGNPNGPSS